MAKVKVEFACTTCGTTSPKWVGKCPGCGEWNTFVEEVSTPASGRRTGLPDFPASKPVLLSTLMAFPWAR